MITNRIQGNTSDIIFLKSTDDSMLQTLETISGKTHRVYLEQKAVTRDIGRMWLNNEGKVTYTPTLKEVPVIQMNDMLFIGERNSMVFRAGDSPVWNKNETILPMSWRLFMNTIEVPGTKYTLQTIPSTSSVLDFDVKNNQPDFTKMLEKRMALSYAVGEVIEQYKETFGYTDDDIARLDKDIYSDDIMKILTESMRRRAEREKMFEEAEEEFGGGDFFENMYDYQQNDDVLNAVEEAQGRQSVREAKIYAGRQLSKKDILEASQNLRHVFMRAYHRTKQFFGQDRQNFEIVDNSLFEVGSGNELIHYAMDYYEKLQTMSTEKDMRVYMPGEKPEERVIPDNVTQEFAAYTVRDSFLEFLAARPNWSFAKGYFEEEVTKILQEENQMDDEEEQ